MIKQFYDGPTPLVWQSWQYERVTSL